MHSACLGKGELSDQWLFGPALMPCPVSHYKARSRAVYFPAGGWYDFYTGAYIDGGRTREMPAPYSRMPLFVRAGSIIPFGPDMEWSDQYPAEDIRLYVYAGADADFTLYEDDGLTYAYEKGACSRIPIHWDDAARRLTIGARDGRFPGMLTERHFHVVLVDRATPHAYDPDAEGVPCAYAGEAVTLNL